MNTYKYVYSCVYTYLYAYKSNYNEEFVQVNNEAEKLQISHFEVRHSGKPVIWGTNSIR